MKENVEVFGSCWLKVYEQQIAEICQIERIEKKLEEIIIIANRIGNFLEKECKK